MTAPILGNHSQTANRFALGDFEVSTILDGAVLRDAVKPPFCMDRSDAEIADLAASHLVPADRFEHVFTPTIVNTGSALVLFDVGFGAQGAGMGAGQLRARMAEIGYKPEDIDIVAFTHVHPDHIAGTMDGDKPAFPNASYVIGQVEFDAWNSGTGIPEDRQGNRDLFLKLIPPLAEKMTFLKEGDTVASGITAVEAFGHSPGHMMFNVESGGKSVLLWADVVNHPVFSLADPSAKVAFDDHKDTAIATRKRVLDMVATDQTMVIGHHMPFPGVGYVQRSGDSYRWQAVGYQIRV